MEAQREGNPNGAMISTAAVQLVREYSGRGPTKAKTTISGDLVTLLLADTLTKGERKLVEGGHADRVPGLRHDFQLVMRDELVAVVERQLERKVIAFMSHRPRPRGRGVRARPRRSALAAKRSLHRAAGRSERRRLSGDRGQE
jgi:uncharacterized protein YbcI